MQLKTCYKCVCLIIVNCKKMMNPQRDSQCWGNTLHELITVSFKFTTKSLNYFFQLSTASYSFSIY